MLSWYSDWAMGWMAVELVFGSWHVREIFFFFSGLSRLALRPTHHPMQWVSGGKATGA